MPILTDSNKDDLWEFAWDEAQAESHHTGESISLLAQKYFEELLEQSEESRHYPNPPSPTNRAR